MGWLFLAAIAAAAMGAFVALGGPRVLWSFVGAAVMLGAAGYALQGHPGMAGRPAAGLVRAEPDDPAVIDIRDRMFGRFTKDGSYLIASDAMMRVGDPDAAMQAILGGIRTIPQSAELWTGLGSRLAARDGNVVSPPASFAFQQAIRLAPLQPGPPFFAGVAYARAGDYAAARRYWSRALRLTPAGTSYRQDIEVRLVLLDRYLAAMRTPPAR